MRICVLTVSTVVSSAPGHAWRRRPGTYCSAAALTLAGVAAFSSPASAACPTTPVGGLLTVSSDCAQINFGAFAAGTSVLVKPGVALGGGGSKPLFSSLPNQTVGDITIEGTLQGRPGGAAAVMGFNASTAALGKVTFVAGSTINSVSGTVAAIDLRGLPLWNGGLENNGNISVATGSSVVSLSSGIVNGSIVNNGSSVSAIAFLVSSNETINGNISNTNAITANSGSGIRLASTTVNGNLLNTGTIRGASGAAFDLATRTKISGLTNGGTISGFDTAISLSGATVSGDIVNSRTMSGKNYGITASGATIGGKIVNNANATISGAVNSLLLNQTGATVTTVDNSGTLSGAVNLGTAGTLNILGDAARVVGATTGTGASRVNIDGNFQTDGNFSVPTFAILGGTTTLVNNANATNTIVGAAGALRIGDGGTSGAVAGNIANSGAVTFNRGDAYTYGGVIGGDGSVTQSGSGTLTLTGANTYTGLTTVASGSALQMGAGGTSGSLAGDIANNGALTFDRSDAAAYNGSISGAGTLTKNGAGALTLGGTNRASSAAVNAGSLILSGANTFTNGATVLAGSTLQVGTGASGSLDGNIANGGALVFNRSDSYTYTGAMSGSGTLTKNGAGAVTLSGTNSASRATVSAGSLILTGANIYTNGATVASGTTLQIGVGATGGLVGNVANSGALIFERSNDYAYGGAITGASAMSPTAAR